MSDPLSLESYDLINYFLRLAGRVGFCILLITLYRLYQLFASPLVRRRNKTFVSFYASILIFSFFLLAVEYILPELWMSSLSMGFNVISTYILVIYINYQVFIIRKVKTSSEFHELSQAFDALIASLKQ